MTGPLSIHQPERVGYPNPRRTPVTEWLVEMLDTFDAIHPADPLCGLCLGQGWSPTAAPGRIPAPCSCRNEAAP